MYALSHLCPNRSSSENLECTRKVCFIFDCVLVSLSVIAFVASICKMSPFSSLSEWSWTLILGGGILVAADVIAWGVKKEKPQKSHLDTDEDKLIPIEKPPTLEIPTFDEAFVKSHLKLNIEGDECKEFEEVLKELELSIKNGWHLEDWDEREAVYIKATDLLGQIAPTQAFEKAEFSFHNHNLRAHLSFRILINLHKSLYIKNPKAANEILGILLARYRASGPDFQKHIQYAIFKAILRVDITKAYQFSQTMEFSLFEKVCASIKVSNAYKEEGSVQKSTSVMNEIPTLIEAFFNETVRKKKSNYHDYEVDRYANRQFCKILELISCSKASITESLAKFLQKLLKQYIRENTEGTISIWEMGALTAFSEAAAKSGHFQLALKTVASYSKKFPQSYAEPYAAIFRHQVHSDTHAAEETLKKINKPYYFAKALVELLKIQPLQDAQKTLGRIKDKIEKECDADERAFILVEVCQVLVTRPECKKELDDALALAKNAVQFSDNRTKGPLLQKIVKVEVKIDRKEAMKTLELIPLSFYGEMAYLHILEEDIKVKRAELSARS